jgi:hypothetical protein
MRASTAYFVGAGSIVAAIAIGLGGGIVAGNIMNPIAPKQVPDKSKIAQRSDAAAPAATNAPSERVQYLTGSQVFGTMVAPPAQAEANAKPEAASAEVKAEPPAPPPAQTAAAEPTKQAPPSPPATKSNEQQASTEPASPPENAYAKARDSDVRRAASERRRTERHERWAERRRYERDARATRDQTNWDDVARNVREDADARDFAGRPRGGFHQSGSFPQIRLFGDDDD